MLRKLHRWISTIGAVFMFFIIVTGVTIAIDEFIEPGTIMHNPGSKPAPSPSPNAASIPAGETGNMTATVIKAALSTEDSPNLTTLSVKLQAQGDKVIGTVTLAGQQNKTLSFDAVSGAPVANPAGAGPGGPGGAGAAGPKKPMSFNALMQKLHSGAYFGVPVQLLVLLIGFSLIFLCVSGVWVFFQMLSKRALLGSKSWFWK